MNLGEKKRKGENHTSAHSSKSFFRVLNSASQEMGIMRCITSSCLNKVARMRDVQSASTSGATSMITEDAEVNGDRLCAVRMLLYASA